MSEHRRRRKGPIYDDVMKVLADDDLDALLRIVGVEPPAEPLDIELAASTVKADLVARTRTGIVHVELVKDPAADLDLRMVDYRLRLRRRHRRVPIAPLKEAPMPVPVRDTPLGRELLEEGRQEGRREGELRAALRFSVLMLRRRFGDAPRIDAVAQRLAELPDDERLARLTDATSLDDLAH